MKFQIKYLVILFAILGVAGIVIGFLWTGGPILGVLSVLLVWVAYKVNKNKKLHKIDIAVAVLWIIILILAVVLMFLVRTFGYGL